MAHSTAPEWAATARRDAGRYFPWYFGGRPSASGPTTLQEILRPVESAILSVELRERIGLDRIDDQMRRLECRPDRKRPACGDLGGHHHPGFESGLRGWRNVLRDPHAERFLRAPVIAGQHVAHRVAPPSLADEAHGRAASGKAAVRVLVLAEARIGRRDPDVARQVELVSEVPRVAVHDHDDGLGQVRLQFAERVDRFRSAQRPPAGNDSRLRRVDIDAARKVLAVTEQHERAQRWIVLVLVEGFREPYASRRIEAVLDERPVETDQRELIPAFHGDRRLGAQRCIRQPGCRRGGWSLALRARGGRDSCERGSCEKCPPSDLRGSVLHGCPSCAMTRYPATLGVHGLSML
jgi:hypothetical protein